MNLPARPAKLFQPKGTGPFQAMGGRRAQISWPKASMPSRTSLKEASAIRAEATCLPIRVPWGRLSWVEASATPEKAVKVRAS